LSEEAKQLGKNLEYLGHVLLNGTTKMEGCLRELEVFCADMRQAVEGFKACVLEEISNGKEEGDERSKE